MMMVMMTTKRRMILLIITTVTIITMTNMATRSPPILSLAGPISSYSDSARDTGRLPAWGKSLQIYSYLQIDIQKEMVYFSIFQVFLITPLDCQDTIFFQYLFFLEMFQAQVPDFIYCPCLINDFSLYFCKIATKPQLFIQSVVCIFTIYHLLNFFPKPILFRAQGLDVTYCFPDNQFFAFSFCFQPFFKAFCSFNDSCCH